MYHAPHVIVSVSSHLRRLFVQTALLVAALCGVSPTTGEAQEPREVRLEENFRREPNGVILGRLMPGSPLRVLATEGNWTQVELEGWVWLASLEASDEAGMDLVVSADGGENLRAAPSGEIIGVLEEGALLEALGREPNWVRVTRVGWVWSASLAPVAASAGTTAAAPSTASSTAAAPSAARAPGGFHTVGALGGSILAAPDGDTVAVAAPSSDVEVVRREGGWARVRVEGWMWLPEAAESDAADGATEVPEPEALAPDELVEAPELYAGRVVSWTIQFISLERAEAVRTDFFEGEPFLLARFGGPDGAFVYVAVPPERLADVEGLVPLETVSVTGRVRTGASTLTGAPIIDLVSLERDR